MHLFSAPGRRYETSDGKTKESLLLISGWWGIARHFHYVPEILGSFFWTVPALFDHVMPYFYVIFLVSAPLSPKMTRAMTKVAPK